MGDEDDLVTRVVERVTPGGARSGGNPPSASVSIPPGRARTGGVAPTTRVHHVTLQAAVEADTALPITATKVIRVEVKGRGLYPRELTTKEQLVISTLTSGCQLFLTMELGANGGVAIVISTALVLALVAIWERLPPR